MPTDDGYRYPNLSPHIRHFRARALAKGAARAKAERWAREQVRKGRRAPEAPNG